MRQIHFRGHTGTINEGREMSRIQQELESLAWEIFGRKGRIAITYG
jgi:hypothetical protein